MNHAITQNLLRHSQRQVAWQGRMWLQLACWLCALQGPMTAACSAEPRPAQNSGGQNSADGVSGGTSATGGTLAFGGVAASQRGGNSTSTSTIGGASAGGTGTLGVGSASGGDGTLGSTSGGTSSMSTTRDAGADASDCSEFVMPADCTIPTGAVLPGELRCTGLYSDWGARTLRCGVRPYKPAYQLWSDAAGKKRYVWLPPGERIDVKDPDNFVFPIGTRFWKEFHVGPASSQKLGETRYLLKVKGGWLYTTYVWSADGIVATQTNDGVANLFDSGHLVPTRDQCKTCHSGRPDYILGWDFVMLGEGATGLTMAELATEGRLSNLEPSVLGVKVPGDTVEQSALSYLHANCGVSCHNQTINATAKPSGLFLRLELAEMGQVLATDAARSGINRLPSPNANYGDLPILDAGDFYDFRPLDVERSLSIARMAYRGSVSAMPPIASHLVDAEGVAAVGAWVQSMTEARGYPAPAP